MNEGLLVFSITGASVSLLVLTAILGLRTLWLKRDTKHLSGENEILRKSTANIEAYAAVIADNDARVLQLLKTIEPRVSNRDPTLLDSDSLRELRTKIEQNVDTILKSADEVKKIQDQLGPNVPESWRDTASQAYVESIRTASKATEALKSLQDLLKNLEQGAREASLHAKE